MSTVYSDSNTPNSRGILVEAPIETPIQNFMNPCKYQTLKYSESCTLNLKASDPKPTTLKPQLDPKTLSPSLKPKTLNSKLWTLLEDS